ncbi:MAG: glycosyltransferase [Patescibacteria group bacterium]|nr:glycosyltransferase [Patescibacteria group bacterium]
MEKKIKVLHILPSLSRGGAEKVCFDIISNLEMRRFSPALLLFKDAGQGLAWKKELAQKGIPVYKLKKKMKIDISNFFKIYKVIKNLKPDIVHTHLGADIYGRLAASLAGVRVIISTEHNVNRSERKIVSMLKKITAPLTLKIFAVSQAVKEDAKKRYRLGAEKIDVIYNGVDVERFSHCYRERKKGEAIIIGSLGRLSQQKGLSVLIEAISLLKNKNFRLLIAGQGELEIELKRQVRRLNLNEKIKFLGKVDAPLFFKKIDIFVFPSLWEGLGLVALEAAAARKPIVASEIDGIKEIIGTESGWLALPGDEHDLALKIDKLLSDIDDMKIREKTQRAQDLVKNRFSLDKMVFNYSVWYEKLLT